MGKIRDSKKKEIKLVGYCQIVRKEKCEAFSLFSTGDASEIFIFQERLRQRIGSQTCKASLISFRHTLNFLSKRYFVERRSKSSSSFCLMASNKGQSEPAGTCEKQGNCSFSLSIRCEARLAKACPCSEAIGQKRFSIFKQPLPKNFFDKSFFLKAKKEHRLFLCFPVFLIRKCLYIWKENSHG